MSKDVKKLIKNKKEIPHNEELGNNYYPSGWKPQRSWDSESNSGTVTHIQKDNNFKYDSLLASWDFDPDLYYIEEDTIKFSTWETQLKGGQVASLYAFKASIKRKKKGHDKYFKKLEREIKKKKPVKVSTKKGGLAYFFILSDWQLGKRDWGADKTIAHLREALVKAKQNIKEINKRDTIDEIYLIGLGDLIENCFGFYDHQPFNVDLTKTEQEHLARVAILECVDNFLPLAPKIILGGVAGNHGENRSSKGSVVTNRLDNSDTSAIQIVGEIISGRERYKHVKVVIPNDFHLTLEVKTKNIAFTHGHMTTGGADPYSKIEKWWKGQMYGFLPAGRAEILVTGHYHHLRIVEQAGRCWIQAPSLDRSDEFMARTGYGTKQGVLSFTVSKYGWDNLRLL